MQLLLVIIVVLIVGFYLKSKMKDGASTGTVSPPDFEDSESQFTGGGVRDLNIMKSDGKGGLRDVGDIGL